MANVNPARGTGYDIDNADAIWDRSNLTRSQFLIWMGQKLAPDDPLYNMVFTFSIGGEIEAAAFRSAFQALVDHSETLRTVFEERDGIPYQHVLSKMPCSLEFVDLSADLDPETTYRAWLNKRRKWQFQLEKRLFDSALIKVAEQQFVWYLNQHHLITDAWSTWLVYRYQVEFYKRTLEDGPTNRSVLASFDKFVAFDRAFRHSDRHKLAKAYWAEKLNLPSEPATFYRKQPLMQTTRSKRVVVDLGPETSQKLKALALEQEASALTLHLSMFSIFTTLLFTYLYRISGNRNLAIGVPFHNRPTAEFKDTMGLFINMFPIQVEIRPDETFVSLLKNVKTEIHSLLRYTQYSPSDTTSDKAYNVVLNYISVSFPKFNGFPTRTTWIHSGYGDSNHDLRLQVHDLNESGSFELDFDFNCTAFTPEQRGWAVGHFRNILDSVIKDIGQPVSQINLLAAEEKQRILREFNQTQVSYPTNETLISLFETQVARTPDSTAVVFEEKTLTYAEVNARANQLAHYLIKYQIGPEILVGVYLERSLEMVISLYAILKAGGAYVPLDPEYPAERVLAMLEDAQVPVVLTHRQLANRLPDYDAEVICLDDRQTTLSQENTDNPVSGVTAENIAYAIFTSGSTGRPKGVMNNHKGICNRLLWMQDAYRLSSADRVLQKTPYSFDVSVWEFFWPLQVGACLVIAQPGGHRDSAYLVRLIAERQITTLHFVPSMLRIFLEEKKVKTCKSLRRVICSGEALPYDLQERFFGRLNAELHNLYGPTEAAVDVTYWACQPGSERAIVPIGYPVANTQIYILDPYLQPVPIGVAGELHIGGVQVARGYLNRPELTAEKFISDPYSEDPDARLYKTGDLVRYLPDGAIEFLGRNDHQVKIRGFRIELGEIGTVLSQHPAVQDATVLALDDYNGEKRLVAYLVPDQNHAFTVRQLVRYKDEEWLAGLVQYDLPNGITVVHKNKAETDFMYQEIFVENTYLKHGITLNDGDCIFDVGANIGLFTLFAGLYCHNATIYAFEPIPAVFETLRFNASLYDINVKLFDFGLSDQNKQETFTYYPHVSLISGRTTASSAEKQIVRSFVLKQQQTQAAEMQLSDDELEKLLSERLTSEQMVCQLKTLSEVIRENKVERIDLLKVDVEKSELNVLLGIAPDDWPKIRQVVVEVHDTDDQVARIKALLDKYGYQVVVEQDSLLSDTRLYNIFAARQLASDQNVGKPVAQIGPTWHSLSQLVGDVRQDINKKLPDYMVPATFVLLDNLPLTLSGKIDHEALAVPDLLQPQTQQSFVAPETALEKSLVNIWSEILGLKQVGIHDDFFELGGHSLHVARVMSRLRDRFQIEVPLRYFFEQPTISELAATIENVLISELEALTDEEAQQLSENFDRGTDHGK